MLKNALSLSRMIFLSSGFFVFVLTATKTYAIQEFETVVTDQKFNSSSTVIIDKKEIEKSHAKNITTLLANQANISIAQTSFQPNSIYLRGGDSSHVLILVDGVPFYDPGTVQRTMNLNTLDLKSVEKIEIIKGSQSVLYGGQALTGVIKIETIPTEIKNSGEAEAEVGTHQSRQVSAGGLKKVGENAGVMVRGSYSERQSESPVRNSTIKYPTRLGTADLAYVQRGSTLETLLKAQTSFDKTNIAMSSRPIFNAVDVENFETSTYQAAVIGRMKYTASAMSPTLSLAARKGARNYELEGSAKEEYNSDLMSGRFELIPYKSTSTQLALGVSFIEERLLYFSSQVKAADDKAQYTGAFVKADYQISSDLKLEIGGRSDVENSKKQIGTYQVGVTLYDLIKAEYSTGFKYPSLSQLYASYGNPNLQPERSISSSLSIEKNITPDLFGSVTLFENRFNNLMIARGSPQKYENVASTQTQGVEGAVGYRLPEKLYVNFSAAYQEPRDLDSNSWLTRRPLQSAALKIRQEIEKIGWGVEIVANGERRDKMGQSEANEFFTTLEGFTYANASVEYHQSDSLTYYLRGENITDQRYQTSFDFYSEGSDYSVGVEATF